MTAKEFENLFENIFEFSYAEGCPYAWPYTQEDDVHCYSIEKGASYYTDLDTFLEQNNLFSGREAVFKEDSDSDEDEYYNEDDDIERQKLLVAKIATWPFEKIVCSCMFYLLSNELKDSGYISSWTWKNIMYQLKTDIIGPELLMVIKRNGFFELDPKEAIQGTLSFFHSLPLSRLGTKSNILRVLECIQVNPKVAEEIVTQTLEHKNLCFITTFLESYRFPKARRISQKEVESYLKCLELSQEEKITIAENARNTLENSSKSWTNHLSTWDEYTFASTLNMDLYDTVWATQQNKKSKISVQETYLALSKFKEVMHIFKDDNLRVISYPPISLVEKFLKTNHSELNSSIIKLLFSPEKVNEENTTSSNWTLICSVAAFFLVLWSRGYNIGLESRDSKFASINLGAMPAFSRSVKESKTTRQVRPVTNKSLDKVKKLNRDQLAFPQSKQSPSPQSLEDPTTKLKVSTYNDGYLLTGNSGPYNKLKTKINKIKLKGTYGLPHPKVQEEVDHLLMSETRIALGLSSTSGSSQDASTAIIVPAFFNKNRTCIRSKAFTRSVSYDQPPDFIEYTKSEVESSVNNLSSSTFRGKVQSISWAAFQEMSDLDQIKQSYVPAINQLTNELNEKVIKRYGVDNPRDAFIIRDLRILHGRWDKSNRKISNSDFSGNFEKFEEFIVFQVQASEALLQLSRSTVNYLDPNKPMTLGLIREGQSLAQIALDNYKNLVEMREYHKKELRSLSLKTTIEEMETKIHFPVATKSKSISELEKLNKEMLKLGVHTPYPEKPKF